jgi:hypothetical protein
VPELIYSTDVLSAADFGSISFTSSSVLWMAQGSVLSVQPGGSVKLSGVSTIDGTINAPAGKITIIGYTNGTFMLNAPPSSQLTIGPNATLNVAGLWVNDTGASGSQVQGRAYINGGSVTIETYAESTAATGNATFNNNNQFVYTSPFVDTTQSILLAPGSVIDVSSGGYVGPNGTLKLGANKLPAGNGGNLSLLTYVTNSGNGSGWQNEASTSGNTQLSQAGNFAPDQGNQPNQANIFIDGTIYSNGLATGGTLALQASSIQIGGVSSITPYTSGAQAGVLALPASFFSSNGFSTYSLTSTYGNVTVVAGTTVLLQQQNYLLGNVAALPASGVPLRDFATLGLAPAGLRQPVNLTLAQQAYAYAFGSNSGVGTNAGILVDNGASIVGEPRAQISLTAAGPVTVLGSITAPGGSITLTNNGAPESASTMSNGGNIGTGLTQAPLDIWIGPNAVLNVGGVFVPSPTSAYETGTALPGGSITLSGGAIVAMPGSAFDLAGTSAVVAIPNPSTGLIAPRTVTQALWSNGGVLTLTGNSALSYGTPGEYQTAYFDGAVNAAGGAPLASGGTLSIGSLGFTSYSSSYTGSSYGAIVIAQGGETSSALNTSALTTPGAAYPTTGTQLAALLPNTNPFVFITGNTLSGSGFDSVSLMASKIAFSGNVTIKTPDALTLAGNITLLPAGNLNPSYTASSIGGTTVNLDAGYLLLASNRAASPTLSDGTLDLNASAQIDLAGAIAISNDANVNLTSGGDIRLLSDTDAEFSTGFFSSGSGNNQQIYFKAFTLNIAGQFLSQSIVQSSGMLVVPRQSDADGTRGLSDHRFGLPAVVDRPRLGQWHHQYDHDRVERPDAGGAAFRRWPNPDRCGDYCAERRIVRAARHHRARSQQWPDHPEHMDQCFHGA